MEEPEVPTEHLHEHIHEHAHQSKERWISFVALSTAIISALAAIASLMAGKFNTEATLEQLSASDKWAYYQAKGIKAEVQDIQVATIKAKMHSLKVLGKPEDPDDSADLANCEEQIKRYKEEQKGIKAKAEELESESRTDLDRHETLAASVTMFQISISVAAISVLMRRKLFFYVSLIAAAVGIFFFVAQYVNAASVPSQEIRETVPSSKPG